MSRAGHLIWSVLHRVCPLPSVADVTRELVDTGEVFTALDIGCGSYSPLTALRPRIRTVGVDTDPNALARAHEGRAHDDYIQSDVSLVPLRALLDCNGGQPFDLVCLYGVVEHLPKGEGLRLLQVAESATCKYVLLETPNGFVPQGPEFDNPAQRHLSGWFPHDFEGLGYSVRGSTGTRYLRGYAAGSKYSLPGSIIVDAALAGVLRVKSNPRHAFNLIAIKDVRGVPARLGATP